ncbi:FGGY-family carbohydrate kinase [Streptomyces sp. NPDC056149]|uniref:FGGY-family carbohydrate kinase n=1 Tax=Streptomyces sp. NPDC056149 TaxID=3345728 RepID=UPI0035D5F76B
MTSTRPRYFIGIDNGSQSSKVTVFDARGRAVSEGRAALRPYRTPRPGIVEHPDDDLWTTIGQASRAALAAFPGDPADIAGVGLCTIRFCRAVLKADGTLAQPVMSWMDQRVSQPHAVPDAAYVTTSSGYLTHRMTGAFRDTAANYAGRWPVDPETWNWSTDDGQLAAFGVTRSMLFDLVQPGEILGQVTPQAAAHTGIPAGIPVVATANDKAVEALGCGLRNPHTLLISLGTYVAGMTTGTHHVPAARDFWTNYASEPGRYLYESTGVRRGMWTVSWYRDLLGEEAALHARAAGLGVEDYLNAQAEKVPAGCDGLMTVLDWLAPPTAPFRKGTLLGFDGRQGRFHIYRSILEALALTIHDTSARMATELGTTFDEVILTGGGSHSDLMMQIHADVHGLPTHRATATSTAGLGAAICTAVALGTYPNTDEALTHMTHPGTVFEPNEANHATYQRLNQVYRNIRNHTDAIYQHTYGIFN